MIVREKGSNVENVRRLQDKRPRRNYSQKSLQIKKKSSSVHYVYVGKYVCKYLYTYASMVRIAIQETILVEIKWPTS